MLVKKQLPGPTNREATKLCQDKGFTHYWIDTKEKIECAAEAYKIFRTMALDYVRKNRNPGISKNWQMKLWVRASIRLERVIRYFRMVSHGEYSMISHYCNYRFILNRSANTFIK